MSESDQSDTLNLVRILRKETSATLKHCLAAVREGGSDLDKSRSLLYKKLASDDVRLKLQNREANDGALFCSVDNLGKIGVIIRFHCETDFVAFTDEFQKTVKQIGDFFLSNDSCDTLEGLNSARFDEDYTVRQLLNISMSILGENIFISDLVKIRAKDGILVPYVYKPTPDDYPDIGRKASIVSISSSADDGFSSYLAGHVCNHSPSVVSVEDLNQSDLQSMIDGLSKNSNDDGFVKEKMEEYYMKEVLYNQYSSFGSSSQNKKTIFHECEDRKIKVYLFKKFAIGKS